MNIKGLYFIVIVLAFQIQVFAQTVSITTEYSTEELVDVFLENNCYEVRNINGSSGQSMGYFESNGSNFPIQSGIVLRSGMVIHTEGKYTGENISSVASGMGDSDLQIVSNGLGQQTEILDVSFLEFDFKSISNRIDFDFVFASNEYGEWQCGSNDIFALYLTELETDEAINLGVLSNSNDPVSVKNIRDATYNTGCISINPELFDVYNVLDPDRSVINMRGQTKLLGNNAIIKPNKWYRIKIAIGDNKDTNFDSAIFIAKSPKSSLDLGTDSVICQGGSRLLDTGLNGLEYMHTWSLNGVEVPGEISAVLKVVQSGTYSVKVVKNNSNCEFIGNVTIGMLEIIPPEDLVVCQDNGSGSHVFDLTVNNHFALGVNDNDYDILYYSSQENLNNDIPISNELIVEYPSEGNEKIYLKVKSLKTNDHCELTYDFKLLSIDLAEIGQPEEILVCGESVGSVNLETVLPKVFEKVDENEYEVDFFESVENAMLDIDKIQNPNLYGISSANTVTPIWIRIKSKIGGCCCSIILQFNVRYTALPLVDAINDVVLCSPGFVLLHIENGDYYSPDGVQLSEGDIITISGTYQIINQSNEGCVNFSYFDVLFVQDFEIELDHCEKYIIPEIGFGSFYSAPNGPTGNGEILTSGLEITQSQDIYFYSEIEGDFCYDKLFSLNIKPLPLIDDPEDIAICNSYTLPPLRNGNYYTGSNGTGSLIMPGTNITKSTILYIFNKGNGCADQNIFKINVFNEIFEDLHVCGEYVLPALQLGKYYTSPLGQGEEIPFGTVIKSDQDEISQQIFVYVDVTIGENCTNNLNFNLVVKPLPQVDVLNDYIRCIDNPLMLPPLTYGNYFEAPNRGGTPSFAGDIIKSTQIIYINNMDECSNESSFKVTIRPIPEIDNFTDIYQCDPFTLPILEYGTYYTRSGKEGEQLFSGDIIEDSQQIFIYNGYDDLEGCSKESVFVVNILATKLDPVMDVSVCDSYILPPLSVGGYFTESNGEGKKLDPYDIIATTQAIYVYHRNEDRFFCVSEAHFKVTVSKTPVLEDFEDIEKCGGYTLPELESLEHEIGYYKSSGGKEPILPSEYFFGTPGVYTIYVFSNADNDKNCYNEKRFELTIHPLLDLNIEPSFLCVDVESGEVAKGAFLNSGLSEEDFFIQWFYKGILVGEGTGYLAEEVGTYTVKTVKYAPEEGNDCNYNIAYVEVEKSSNALANVTIDEVFKNNLKVTVDVYKGVGVYRFQLDDGQIQSNNEFYGVQYGEHTITIYDVYGACEATILDFMVLNYPRFFTPNGDGINDTWNIWDLKEQPAQLFIYDRYGKLMDQLYTDGSGWDGNMNNNKTMPSGDYWFKVIFDLDGIQKVYRSHFSLKR